MALTKLDVLDYCDELKLCTGYRINGEVTQDFPAHLESLEQVEPVYETVAGWKRSTQEARSWTELPRETLAYVSTIENTLRIPVALLSVGADRNATFSRLAIWEGI